MAEKSKGKLLAEQLLDEGKHFCEQMDQQELERADLFCEEYKEFLASCKTERECVDYVVPLLKSSGYVPFVPGTKYQPGDKVYYNNRGKALAFATIGTRSFADGVKIMAAHIDSPRLDLKPRPLYEEAELALLKTHYYGGIKKYQWPAMPLSLHGVVVRRDGTSFAVNIGEDPADPVFCVTDLLPHLADEQAKRQVKDAIKGEELNVLVGSRPFLDDQVSQKVKLNVANILFEKYGMVEKDFLSAELCVVPAFPVRDVGLDRSMIGAYGHDDRVCAYTALKAALEVKSPAYTLVTVLADKEETGSDGNTGMNSAFFRYFIADLAAAHGVPERVVLSRSQCLSADVNLAFDPTFPDVTESRNTAYLNHGVVVTKYTGARGKSSTNDASAEFMGKIRSILDRGNVQWQTGELGKVDMGGGGTVAMYISALNVDVVDIGVPVLSMHAPFEVVSKSDVYMTYRAFVEFGRDADDRI